MTIPALIDKQDNIEIVRATVASILAVETASQQALATAAAEDPRLWTWRVFEERAKPWSEFLSAAQADTDPADVPPIVCVRVDRSVADRGASDTVERQTYNGRLFLDCYGYGVSEAAGQGHTPGDLQAANEAMRAARLVRNVLMAGEYTYLGLRGTVGRRLISELEVHHDNPDGAFNVAVVRMVLDVRFVEVSPQVVAEAIGGIDISVERIDQVSRLNTGEVLFTASFDATP